MGNKFFHVEFLNLIFLSRLFDSHIYAFQAENKKFTRSELIAIQFYTYCSLIIRDRCINGCSGLPKVIPFCRAGTYEPKKAGIARGHIYHFRNSNI